MLKKKWTINILESYWLEFGAKIVYYHDVDQPIPNADLWIQHLDSSVVPNKYRKVMNKLPNVVNGKLLDIRKNAFSEQRISDFSTSYNGQIIVKSNDNCGGYPELSESRYNQKKSIYRKIKRILTKKATTKPPFAEYKLYESLQDVPRQFFNSEQVIIEKFIPQRDGDYYVLYMTYIFLEQHITFKIKSYLPIMKWDDHVTWEYATTQPDILDWARQHHVEYGKIDYVYADNQLIVYDINKTPGLGNAKIEEERDFAETMGPAILTKLFETDTPPL